MLMVSKDTNLDRERDAHNSDLPQLPQPEPIAWGTPYTRLMEAEANLRSLLPHTFRHTGAHTSLKRALEYVAEVGEYLLREEAKAQQIREAQEKEAMTVSNDRL
jgi:hypothetical protein